MELITEDEKIGYVRFSSGREEVLGQRITEPFFLSPEDIKPDSDPINKWIQALSQNYKETGSKEVYELLIKLENNDPVKEEDFIMIDNILKSVHGGHKN